ncbi:hypothetical protein AB8S09_14410 [Clostridium sp. MT-113]|uniref:O-antigen ligase domain-containing protein n=1 Tax=Clostridium lapidicellarium TaxID=3240931 RepID=A0ABV4E0X9_9CLOT
MSPYVNNFTIYIYWFIPFLDIFYLLYLLKGRYNKRIVLLVYLFLLFLIFKKDYITALKIVSIISTILYLFYLKKYNLFKLLYTFMFLNIFIAIIQFVFLYVNPNISNLLGPTNISNLVWGKYATPTFTNFYTIFLFPRVSGWSREAGFFASLLGITYIIYLSDKNKKIKKLKSLSNNFLFIVGFIISLSKASISIIGIGLIIKLKRILNKIPLFLGVILFLFVVIFISNKFLLNMYYDPSNASIVHRISGYTIMSKMPITELFLGKENMEDISIFNEYPFLSYISQYKQFAGLPNTIIHEGLITFIFYIILLYLLKVRFSGFLIITLITATTDYFTATSFVVLGYFYVLNSIFTKNDITKKRKKLRIIWK